MKETLCLILFALSLPAFSQNCLSEREVFRVFRQKPRYIPAAPLVRADSATLYHDVAALKKKILQTDSAASGDLPDMYTQSIHYLMVYKKDTVLVDNTKSMGEDVSGTVYYKSKKFSFAGIIWQNKPQGNNFLNRLYVYHPACCAMRFDELGVYSYLETGDSLRCMERHFVPAHDWSFSHLPRDSVKHELLVIRQTELKHGIKKNDVFETILHHRPQILQVQTKLTILSTVSGYYFVRRKQIEGNDPTPSYYYGWVKQSDCKVLK